MSNYCGIDLHSNNCVIVVIDSSDNIVLDRKTSTSIGDVLDSLSICRDSIKAIAVESTYNWYWLVDGLQEAGYHVELVNTSAVKQYEGLKYSDDKSDARHLAHLLRLGILPTGYIYPPEERAVRDLLRRRLQLVRQRTTHVQSMQNQLTRNTGKQFKANEIKKLSPATIKRMLPNPNIQEAILSNLTILSVLQATIKKLEKSIINQVKLKPEFKQLRTVPGIGVIMALTIMLETGDINRFAKVGNYVSYCRCVDSKRMSNKKQKGQGNRKSGNKYLAWAFIEVANFSLQFNEQAKRFYQKKLAKTKRVIALKALAHKMARACYYIMKNNEEFNNERLFA